VTDKIMAADPLATASSATISDCLNRFGAMRGDIQLVSGKGLRGPAFTVATMAGESSTIHRAVAAARAGSVLVVDASGATERAVWGEILTLAARRQGLLGVVVDGAVRDIQAIRANGFCVFAAGRSPAGPHKGWTGSWGTSISCGGLIVAPGDLVVGDDDGVVVIPGQSIDVVRRDVSARLELEAQWRQRIEDGDSTVDIMGFDARASKETTK
jgi:4-hydroxy-4-methyl-2-oxoglutarate aldolase